MKALHPKHDLENRKAARLSCRVEIANNHGEGIVLMFECRMDRRVDLRKNARERLVARNLCSDRQRIHKIPDHLLEFGTCASAHRRADDNVRHAAMPMQQNVEGRQQHREQCGACRPSQSLQLLHHDVCHFEAAGRAPTERIAWPRMIRRKQQRGRRSQELLPPEGAVFLALRPRDKRPLPGYEVSESSAWSGRR